MENKKYIFPMNYKRKEKFLGVIDYKVLMVSVVIGGVVFYLLKNIAIDIIYKIVLFIFFAGIPIVFILVGANGENMIDFMCFVLKYFIKERVYVYKKVEEEDKFYEIYKKLVSYKKY